MPGDLEGEFEQFQESSEREELLRKALRSAHEKLRIEKISKEDLVQAVHNAAREAIAGLTFPSIPKPKPDRRQQNEETAIAVLSDWQLAKRTPTYNTQVCDERIGLYADKVLRLTDIQRADHAVKSLRVYLLGDLLEGELVFPGQAHLIDASLYSQVLVDGPRILGTFLRRMLSHFDSVHVVGVIGNHGALGGKARKDYHPETNADAMLYEVTRLSVTDSRLTWAPNMTPGERHWYAIDQIGSKKFLLFHGDQIKGHAGYPWYGTGRAVQGWAIAFDRLWSEERFDYALYGHFHTPNRLYMNGLTAWCNGSTESHNPYAMEQLKSSGEPCQWLLFTHPELGISAEYLVHLSDKLPKRRAA